MSLNIVIDADVQTATSKIGKFVYTFKESFKEVETTVKRTSTKVKQDTNKIGDSIDSFGKSSRNALTALSLTIQDLPFGFIGIQNNLPGVIQGFAQMNAEAKTGTSVTQQLVSSLSGPGGLFLAFSAVTAAATFAIQKYGSFGNAIDAIFGKNEQLILSIKKAGDSYKEFNKELRTSEEILGQESASVSGNISTIQSLSRIVLDQTESYEKRNAALNSLKELSKDYFGNLDIEKTKIDALNSAIIAYTQSIIQSAITKGFEEEIGRTNVELNKQDNLLKSLKKKLDDLEDAPQKIVGLEARVDKRDIIPIQNAYDAQVVVVNTLKNRVKELNLAIDESIQKQNALKAPIDAANAAIKAQEEAEKNRLKTLKKLTKAQEDYKKGWEGIIDELERIRKDKFESIGKSIDYNVTQQFKKIAEATKKATEAQAKYKKGMEGIISALQQRDSLQMTDPFPMDWAEGFKDLAPRLVQETNALTAVEFMKNNFFDPLTELFENFLNTGKFAFEDFGKTVLKTINQIIARMIATDLINSFAGLLFPGGAGALGQGSGIGRLLKFGIGAFTGGGVAAPSFAGVGGGSFGMSGQVSVVLRGQDLVGAINRTNATINRVG